MRNRIRLALALLTACLLATATSLSWAYPPAPAPVPAPDAKGDASGDTKSDPNIVYLSPDHDLWIDKKQHEVVMKGKIAVREGNLEMFACPEGTKEHESIVAVATKARPVHAALLALGAKVGHPSHYDSKTQKFTPASGSEIEVFVRWTDDKGKHEARGQDWVRNIKTQKPLEYPWVFGGSILEVEDNGEKYYQADYGDFICVSNFPTAMMDLPIDSPKAWADHLFEPFTDRIPPRGTAVELVLKPKLDKPKTNPGETPK
ncbi:MAG TPA: YdjY domain-containing protein [Pirellulales bacterium]|jgi:hypothetical protein|nr:YdjY domain-containing protein [Pirellulales bacterium]